MADIRTLVLHFAETAAKERRRVWVQIHQVRTTYERRGKRRRVTERKLADVPTSYVFKGRTANCSDKISK